ncbi:MAG: TetR/AcrR family transcriptional regulator [Actinomycetota bacterium]|nr:TetR/AcrR family transcriptional regulator [Actinomycetota bacterium]MDQ2956780.1 TetR/AcrR family transcriptional regulator [Actinomycetota bacterium]
MKPARKTDGRSARWDAHRLARRAELVALTVACVEQHGSSVGMDQIAAFAGTSKAVFYRHFADKADLYRAVGQQLAAGLGDQLSSKIAEQSDPRGMVTAGIEAYLAVLDKNPALYRFVVSNPILERAGGDPVADYTGLIAARLDELIARLPGPLSDPVLRRPWGTAIVGLVKAAGDWWLDHPDAMTRSQLAESLTTLLWGGPDGLRETLTPSDNHVHEGDPR